MADSKHNIYPEPLPAYRFLVRLGNRTDVSAAFTRFSGIRMQVETLEFRGGDDPRGVKEYTPVFTKYDPVTLSKGVVGDNDFLDWLFSATAGESDGPSKSGLYQDVEITALNEFGMPGVVWRLLHALPIGYELSPMDGSRSEILVENISLAIAGVTRESKEWKDPRKD